MLSKICKAELQGKFNNLTNAEGHFNKSLFVIDELKKQSSKRYRIKKLIKWKK